jgi:hypothetical protein
MSSAERRYGAHELREILKRAERREPAPEEAQGLTRSELLEIGREVGVSEEQMTTALARYDSEQELLWAEAEVQQLMRRGFVTHLIAFVWVGAALGLLSLWAGPPILIPMLLWALGLTLHVRSAFFPDPDALRIAARKRLVRQRLRDSSRHFGEALADGAARVLSAAAERLDSTTGRRTGGPREAESDRRPGGKRTL